MRFTSRQIATIVVALCAAAILTPVSVAAATGSSTTIVDSVNPASKARVNAAGEQLVASVPFPAHPWNSASYDGGFISFNGSTARVPVFSGVGIASFEITSLTFTSDFVSTKGVQLRLTLYISPTASGDCTTLTGATFGIAERMPFDVPAGETIHLDFPTPLAWGSRYEKPGRLFCLVFDNLSPGGTYAVTVLVNGFVH